MLASMFVVSVPMGITGCALMTNEWHRGAVAEGYPVGPKPVVKDGFLDKVRVMLSTFGSGSIWWKSLEHEP
jgi:hypothetical protein